MLRITEPTPVAESAFADAAFADAAFADAAVILSTPRRGAALRRRRHEAVTRALTFTACLTFTTTLIQCSYYEHSWSAVANGAKPECS